MPQILSELFRSEFMINSGYWRRTHLVQSGTATTSSGGSYPIQNSGSHEDLKRLMDQRKRKRMVSNRESARRSRMRKQKHLDDLMIQLSQLRKENNQIISSVSITTQHYMGVEEENSELYGGGGGGTEFVDEFMSYVYANQPILASADMIQY
ncbi:Basic-leucine zipper domain-containing protein [Cynara cardunculus var. scolymus]|uniref:Basic-leucine zipper domain-containing protein n=1 Tax=Cynara cardunculus var. scolymus TaxID=59895 RepID=A0A103Y3R7_CYNCS|nr:Basic-leucine zipper domain-containing protein [Cynara cardunculus var. scolymus]